MKHSFGDVAQTKLTPFLTRNKDEIFLDPTVYPGNNGNYGRTRRRGVDLENTFHLAPFAGLGWVKAADISLDYRYLQAEFDGGSFGGKQIPLTPQHQGAIGLDLAVHSGFIWNFTVRFSGEQYGINDDNNVKPRMKPSMVADTRVGWRHKDAWETFVGVNNLFDEKYYEYLSYGAGVSTNIDYYPAMGRNYTAGVKYKF